MTTTMSSTSDKKSNFFFANCLQCEGIIRIPITIRPDSSVSCPHCSTQFDLFAYLDQIPEVSVSEGGTQNADSVSDSDEFQIDTGEEIEKQDGKYIVPPQIAAGMRKRRGRRRRRSSSSDSVNGAPSNSRSSPSSSVSSASSDPNAQLSEAEELKLERREDRARREREKLTQQREAAALREGARRSGRSGASSGRRPPAPKRSPVMETVKIIVGGMLAAPIAYLLLMWGFSRDPLGIVPTIHQYAPVLVPSKLILDDQEDFVPNAETKVDPTDILTESDFEDDLENLEGDVYKSEIEID